MRQSYVFFLDWCTMLRMREFVLVLSRQRYSDIVIYQKKNLFRFAIKLVYTCLNFAGYFIRVFLHSRSSCWFEVTITQKPMTFGYHPKCRWLFFAYCFTSTILICVLDISSPSGIAPLNDAVFRMSQKLWSPSNFTLIFLRIVFILLETINAKK